MKKIIEKIVSLWRKALNWVRKLLKMNGHIYYCRIYVEIDIYRILIPFFINGKDKKEVNDVLFKTINTIHNSGSYMVEGMEPKILLVAYPPIEEELGETITGDFEKGQMIVIPAAINPERGNQTGMKVRVKENQDVIIPFFGAKNLIDGHSLGEIQIPVILVGKDYIPNIRFPVLYLTKYLTN